MAPGTGIPELDDVVGRVPMFATAEEVSSEQLSGGLTNVSHLVTVDGETFVVRVAGGDTPVLGIDRAREAAAIHNASAAGISPETVAFLLPEGHSVTRYLPNARPVTLDEARSDGYLRRIAERLRQIHDLPAIDGEFDPYSDIERWLAIAEQRGIDRSRRLDGLLRRIEKVRLDRMLALDASVLCHNDSYYLNVLDDGETLWVIDWEYAGMGDPMYDLAANAFELPATGKDTLLQAYFGETNDDLRATLDDMIAVFLAWNVAWSMVQEHDSDTDYDYLAYAEQLLNLVPPER
jgi:thiamine kinase-like enzyme